jgi:hypothetical protein
MAVKKKKYAKQLATVEWEDLLDRKLKAACTNCTVQNYRTYPKLKDTRLLGLKMDESVELMTKT